MTLPALSDLLASVDSLYRQLPPVDCKGCGICCVSPTCTLAEFIYFAAGLSDRLSDGETASFLSGKSQQHPHYEGNLRCRFLRKSQCAAHDCRTGACRLFGVPALEKMQINDMVYCKNQAAATGSTAEVQLIIQWLRELVRLNMELFPIGIPAYFLTGLNLECWFDLYFDVPYPQPFFAEIQQLLVSSIDLSRFAALYRPQTGLREKIAVIDRFNKVIDCGDPAFLRRLLLRIKNDFPLTGTYFAEEADRFLAQIGLILTEPAA